jgi:hypothetical protein
MKSYKDYIEQRQIVESITDILALRELDSDMISETLNEGVVDKIKKADISGALKKVGLHASQSNRGLIQYLLQAGKGVAKMFIALIKGDTERVKEIVKSVKKADVLDFLLKLDMATLHIISNPIHTLDAITGWHIWANVSKKIGAVASDIIQKIKDSIEFVKTEIIKVVPKKKAIKHQSYLDAMESDLVPA